MLENKFSPTWRAVLTVSCLLLGLLQDVGIAATAPAPVERFNHVDPIAIEHPQIDSEVSQALRQRLRSAIVLKTNSVNVIVNGLKFRIDGYRAKPFLYNDDILIPARFVAEHVGATVQVDPLNSRMTIALGQRRVQLINGKNGLTVENATGAGSAEVQLVGKTLYVSAGPFCRALGKQVSVLDGGIFIISDNNQIFIAGEDSGLIRHLKTVMELPHPIYSPDRDVSKIGALKRSVADIMTLSDDQVLAIVPEQNPWAAIEIDPGTKKRMDPSWDYRSPFTFVDKNTGLSYPNDTYPLNKTREFLNISGKKVTVAYHQDAEGKPRYLGNALLRARGFWLMAKVKPLAQLYYLTGETSYAKRSALILMGFGQQNPNYLSLDWGWFMSSKPPLLGWYESRWGGDLWVNELNENFISAYDLIYDSGAVEALSKQYRREVRRHIENDLLKDMADYPLRHPWGKLYNNQANFMRPIVMTGRVIQQPEYVHMGYKYIKTMFRQYGFNRDGLCAEGPVYMRLFYATLGDLFGALEGHQDPPGFIGASTGLHLDNVSLAKDLNAEKRFYDLGKEAMHDISYPNGSFPTIHDAGGLNSLMNPFFLGWWDRPASSSQVALKDGFGHAVLGAGRDMHQTQVHLHYSQDGSHSHDDTMSLILYAFGREMINDIGYSRTSMRPWSAAAESHNTVVIDCKRNRTSDSKGYVRLFSGNQGGISLMQVDGKHAIHGVETYRRSIILNAVDEHHPYVVDVFEVHGGKMHDYILHGTRAHEQEAVADLPLKRMPGDAPFTTKMTPKEVKDFWAYGNFSEVSTARSENGFSVDFKYVDPWRSGAFVYDAMGEDEDLLASGTVIAAEGDEESSAQAVLDQLDRAKFQAKSKGETMSMTVDLQKERVFNKLVCNVLYASAKSFMLETSLNGTLWSPVTIDPRNSIAKDNTISLFLPSRSARYIRLSAAANAQLFAAHLYNARVSFQELAHRRTQAVGCKTHVVIAPAWTAGGVEVFLGKTPTVMLNGVADETDIRNRRSQSLLVRRTGDAPLSSVFVTVHEPYEGRPQITAIRPMTVTPAENGQNHVVALQISMGERTDFVLLALGKEQDVRVPEHGIALRGRFLSISQREEIVNTVVMSGQGTLTRNGRAVVSTIAKNFTGEVKKGTSMCLGAAENAIVTTAALPVGEALAGRYVRINHGPNIARDHLSADTRKTLLPRSDHQPITPAPGKTNAYKIRRVEMRAGEYWIILDEELGLHITDETTTELYDIKRVYAGRNTFEIDYPVAQAFR